MQIVLIIYCFIYKVSLLFTALYAKCPHYLVLSIHKVAQGYLRSARGRAMQAEHAPALFPPCAVRADPRILALVFLAGFSISIRLTPGY